ncbi:4-alpha-glucanotransferase [Butyrivibrio sp. WCD2001]|uniref:4-alpha-glucanotransferase n=1 Tax=Butyrivibrio sp. WCD2001 TaxID=1280681 RepID=UPI0003F6B18D|nr:4-alpha-glucanotransferase [Butyrivibrio sp. WCD2001]
MSRESGILMPVFSLASKFGIGCFSREAYDFVDFLEKSYQGFWQILPIGPTGFGNSPYQPISAFAGNPYFISPEKLIEEGLLTWDDINGIDFGSDQEKVDYGKLYENRPLILKKAYENFLKKGDMKAFKEYRKTHEYWLEDYALYVSIKAAQDGKSWLDWPENIRKRDPKALDKARGEFKDEIEFICFEQFKFDEQWKKLHKYALEHKVKIIGDLPFYVAMDSADSWSHPEVFQMDKDLVPKAVAGCPPDAFSKDGQLWGNPVYDWDYLKKNDYSWWVKRIKRNYEWFDVIRIDHFHGFAEYYEVPYGDKDARGGKQMKGPGMDLFKALEKQLGKLNMIAEDLGTTTEENIKLLEDSGFPGMKVLQYGFTSWDSIYVNHRHTRNSVVYTGTHDNTPTFAWVQEISDGERDFTRRYINSLHTNYGALVWDIIREAYRSVADLCIVPLVDYLCKGKEARINTPGTADGNWMWRLLPNYLSEDLARSIRLMAETYSRIPAAPPKNESEEESEE